jgi:pimeloyl-ACP methyl ester carboxylesterase
MPSLNPTHIDDERWQHGFAFVDEAREVRIHYIDCPPEGKQERGTVLLIHGYPNTSYQWRHVITPISNAGYRVIAPDYRGAGDSSHPRSGYDKVTVADDLYKVVHDHLGTCRKRRPSLPLFSVLLNPSLGLSPRAPTD